MMKSKTSNGKTKHSAPRSRTSSSESLDGPSAMLEEEFHSGYPGYELKPLFQIKKEIDKGS